MTAQPTPLRIQRLALTDFRAFPGPAPQSFDLAGKNLLVYGENGAGKSSLFHALREFFSLRPARRLDNYRNVFSKAPQAGISVAVEFNDGGATSTWSLHAGSGATGAAPLGGHSLGGPGLLRERHPAKGLVGSDARVVHAALRRACLDYRALLDTNYKQGDGEINLFDIAVQHLVHDFPVPVSGGQTRNVGELWDAVQKAKPKRQTDKTLRRVNEACATFNQALNQALAGLHPHVGKLLGELIGADVVVQPFRFAGVTYRSAGPTRDRGFDGMELKPEVTFRAHALTRPQHFLNEGRLSALALAIYLGGRLACTPSAPGQALKLLVLDDVLIGLDHSNRLPVLDVLLDHFADWQIVLLTHDHVWFEMARMHLGATNLWNCLEVYEATCPDRGIPSPRVMPTGAKAAQACLRQAREFLDAHHVPAAANYTRAAFELALKQVCERFGVPVAYKMDSRHVDTEALLSAVERWFDQNAGKIKTRKGEPDRPYLHGAISRVKLFRKVVLNPYSHAAPPNIAPAEVDGAIGATEALLAVLEPCTSLGDGLTNAARALLTGATVTSAQVVAALGYARAAFSVSLGNYCERKHVPVPHAHSSPSANVLWDRAKSDANNPIPSGFVAMVEPAHSGLLIDEVNDATLAGLSAATVLAALNAIADANHPEKVALDAY